MLFKKISIIMVLSIAFTWCCSCASDEKSNVETSFGKEYFEEKSSETFGETKDIFTSEQSEEFHESISKEDDSMSNEGISVDPLEVGFEQIKNPFLENAADPFIMRNGDKYYYIFSTGVSIYISSFDSLSNVTLKGAKCVFAPMNGTEYSRDIWAPELHFIDGSWYIYFAACDGNNENHRMFVLKSKTEDPMGEYDFIGKVSDSTDRWAIDGTVFTYKDEMYFAWSGWMTDKNIAQRIYIAKMSSPTQISSERVCISIPTYRWETRGGRPKVNEGPAVITDGEYLSIIYSASGSWCDDYCLGQLIFEGGDVLNSTNWKKHREPILQKDENRFFGPGHCSIVADEKGVMWLVFHANLESGTGWNGRSGWMYPIRINEDGIVEVIFYD